MKKSDITDSSSGKLTSEAVLYNLKQSEFRSYLAPVIGTIMIFVIGQILAPGFGSAKSIFNFLATASVLIFACLPQTLIILNGKAGIDLSLGSLMSLSVAWGGALSGGTTSGLLYSMACMALIGLLCGLCNGFAVQYWGVPAMVVTLCIGSLLDGSYLAITKGKPIGNVAPILLDIGTSRVIGYLRWVLLIAIVIVIIVEFILRYTKYGKQLYLVGTNNNAAQMSGIKANLIGVITYAVAGVSATLAGFMLLGVIGSTQAGAGTEYTMLSVASVVIGGTNIAGGKGTFLGSALGAIMFTVLIGFLVVIQLPEGARDLIKGLVLILILVAYARAPKLRQ
jgi:ribose transport system permease protein